MPDIHMYNTNKGISDRANNILERNTFSLNSSKLENLQKNYKTLHSLSEMNKESNNYLKPIEIYNHKEKYSIKDDMTNQETYKLAKNKFFANDKESKLQPGEGVSKADYINKKQEIGNIRRIRNDNVSHSTEKVIDHNLYFDKNNKEMIRFPKGYWGASAE
jgi:hypothetical protein